MHRVPIEASEDGEKDLKAAWVMAMVIAAASTSSVLLIWMASIQASSWVVVSIPDTSLSPTIADPKDSRLEGSLEVDQQPAGFSLGMDRVTTTISLPMWIGMDEVLN